MFYFFYKIIIFSLNKEKSDIYEARTVNSHNSEPQSTTNPHVIFVLHSAMKTRL